MGMIFFIVQCTFLFFVFAVFYSKTVAHSVYLQKTKKEKSKDQKEINLEDHAINESVTEEKHEIPQKAQEESESDELFCDSDLEKKIVELQNENSETETVPTNEACAAEQFTQLLTSKKKSSSRPSLFENFEELKPNHENKEEDDTDDKGFVPPLSSRKSTKKTNFNNANISLLSSQTSVPSGPSLTLSFQANPNEKRFIRAYAAAEDTNKAGMRRARKKIQQEDRHFAQYPFSAYESVGAFGVFDGFGGFEVSQKCKEIFPRVLESKLNDFGVTDSMETVLMETISELDTELYSFDNGCTATIVLIWEFNGEVYVQSANLGDSNAILCVDDSVITLTEEHKVVNEIERIRKDGIKISDNATRLCGISIARGLGVGFFKKEKIGIISLPYVSKVYKIPSNVERVSVVLCCDGVWDVLSGQQVANIVFSSEVEETEKAAINVAKKSVNSDGCDDNVTVVVVNVK